MKRISEATHTRPDLDALACITLHRRYSQDSKKERRTIFLKGANEVLADLGITLFDRGRSGPFDHHQKGMDPGETSTSLVAKHFAVHTDKHIQKFLGLVQRSDRAGESLPFDLSHITKCIQRNFQITDGEALTIGVRLVEDTLQFSENNLQRDHRLAESIIREFLRKKNKRVPREFLRYLDRLSNPRFQRPFDFVEIIGGEKERFGEEETIETGNTILELVWFDLVTLFQYAMRDVENSDTTTINGITLTVGYSDNSKYNAAARFKRATVIVQRISDRHTQIFFNTREIDDRLTDALISVIRLEECLIRGREIPKVKVWRPETMDRIPEVDLRKPEIIEEIPEWYFFKGPIIGNRPPGRFIFNGSLTVPEVPKSKIPFELLLFLVRKVVKSHPRFNWKNWKESRIDYYKARKVAQSMNNG